jgi:hypothetical protein
MANFLGSSEDYLDATHLAHLRSAAFPIPAGPG